MSQENCVDSGGVENCGHFCDLPAWPSSLYYLPNVIRTSTLEVKANANCTGGETEAQVQLLSDGPAWASPGNWSETQSLEPPQICWVRICVLQNPR